MTTAQPIIIIRRVLRFSLRFCSASFAARAASFMATCGDFHRFTVFHGFNFVWSTPIHRGDERFSEEWRAIINARAQSLLQRSGVSEFQSLMKRVSRLRTKTADVFSSVSDRQRAIL